MPLSQPILPTFPKQTRLCHCNYVVPQGRVLLSSVCHQEGKDGKGSDKREHRFREEADMGALCLKSSRKKPAFPKVQVEDRGLEVT